MEEKITDCKLPYNWEKNPLCAEYVYTYTVWDVHDGMVRSVKVGATRELIMEYGFEQAGRMLCYYARGR